MEAYRAGGEVHVLGAVVSNGRWVRRHRAVMEELLGVKLSEGVVVHHIDGNVKNNSVDNLAVVTRGGHGRLHCVMEGRRLHERRAVHPCPVCRREVRDREDNGQRRTYCSRECYLVKIKLRRAKVVDRSVKAGGKQMKAGCKYISSLLGMSYRWTRKLMVEYGGVEEVGAVGGRRGKLEVDLSDFLDWYGGRGEGRKSREVIGDVRGYRRRYVGEGGCRLCRYAKEEGDGGLRCSRHGFGTDGGMVCDGYEVRKESE